MRLHTGSSRVSFGNAKIMNTTPNIGPSQPERTNGRMSSVGGIAPNDPRLNSTRQSLSNTTMGSSPSSTINQTDKISTPSTKPHTSVIQSQRYSSVNQVSQRPKPSQISSDDLRWSLSRSSSNMTTDTTNNSGTTSNKNNSASSNNNNGGGSASQQIQRTPQAPPNGKSQQQRPAHTITHSGQQQQQPRQSQTPNSLSSQSTNAMLMQQQQRQQQEKKSQAQQQQQQQSPVNNTIVLNRRQFFVPSSEHTQPFRATGINPAILSNLSKPRSIPTIINTASNKRNDAIADNIHVRQTSTTIPERSTTPPPPPPPPRPPPTDNTIRTDDRPTHQSQSQQQPSLPAGQVAAKINPNQSTIKPAVMKMKHRPKKNAAYGAGNGPTPSQPFDGAQLPGNGVPDTSSQFNTASTPNIIDSRKESTPTITKEQSSISATHVTLPIITNSNSQSSAVKEPSSSIRELLSPTSTSTKEVTKSDQVRSSDSLPERREKSSLPTSTQSNPIKLGSLPDITDVSANKSQRELSPRRKYSDQILTAVGLQSVSKSKKANIAPTNGVNNNQKPTCDTNKSEINPVSRPIDAQTTNPAVKDDLVTNKKTPNKTANGWFYFAEQQPFHWDVYLEAVPAEVAPNEAFNQTLKPLRNKFLPGMKLESRDPRSNAWALATVLWSGGLRLRLRFDGSDKMNDFFEVIDSDRIRTVGASPTDILCAPIGFQSDIARYPAFVEKTLSSPDVTIAPPECFYPPSKNPPRNLFQRGMKLEAVDRKNTFIICPATVAKVKGDDVDIIFDGWKGAFGYTCKYYSKDLFPINWCRDTGYIITPPHNWNNILDSKLDQTNKPAKASATNSRVSSPQVKERKLNKTKSSTSHKRTKSSLKQQRSTSTPTVAKSLSPSLEVPEADAVNDEQNPMDDIILSEISRSPTPFKEDTPGPSGDTKFQCQRTIPYDQWRLTKEPSRKQAGKASEGTKPFTATKGDKFVQSPTPSDRDVSVAASNSSTIANASISSSTKTDSNPDPNGYIVELAPSEDNSSPIRKKMRISPPEERVKSKLDLSNASKPLSLWTVEDVLDLIQKDESLSKYSKVFEDHEIDGRALELLSTDVMIKQMGIKIGPVLKIKDLVEKLKQIKP